MRLQRALPSLRALGSLLIPILAFTWAGCGGPDRQEITEVRMATAGPDAGKKASTQERLGLQTRSPHDTSEMKPPMMIAAPGEGGDKAPETGGFDPKSVQWTVPAGWQAAPERQMRVVSFTGGGEGGWECYVSVLSGPAGGLEANLKRWRQQMGLAEYSADEIAALPKSKVLGQEAPMVDISGTYTDMSGTARPGYRMLAVVCPLGGQTLFVKMTGPEAAVAAEKPNFEAFCASLHTPES